ncbi:MAG: DUF58 domain-containing protein [Ruminococcus sp.]|nr:DUF58 domain-containing protein [Ruminococcus sp.]
MIKNLLMYIIVLSAVFMFSIFYNAWFSWYLLIFIISLPFISAIFSLPFMINTAVNGINLYCNEKSEMNRDFKINVSFLKNPILFCPDLYITLKVENQFSSYKSKLIIKFSGRLNNSFSENFDKITEKCGYINFNIKHCRVYDMLGLFFIPVRNNHYFSTTIIPKSKKTSILPNIEKLDIIGYKPKIGGYSDFYELRSYQSGDNIKNIHWKLSTKSDNIIVREPAQPITKKPLISIHLTKNPVENADIIGRLIYVAEYMLDCGILCNISEFGSSFYTAINSKNELSEYIINLYNNIQINKNYIDKNHFMEFLITATGEEII